MPHRRKYLYDRVRVSLKASNINVDEYTTQCRTRKLTELRASELKRGFRLDVVTNRRMLVDVDATESRNIKKSANPAVSTVKKTLQSP